MAIYKDVEPLIENLKLMAKYQIGERQQGILGAIESIKLHPTAHVVEVKHGQWELKSEIRRFLEEVDEDFYVECPFCHRVYYVPFEFEDEKMLEYAKKNYPYCNCGAKMDGQKWTEGAIYNVLEV